MCMSTRTTFESSTMNAWPCSSTAPDAAKTSGLEYSPEMTRTAHLFHVHDGKVVKFLFYLDRHRALADLGLEE